MRLVNGHDLTYAASIAYYALLSLLPFLLLVLTVLGAATADQADRTAVMDFVFRYFPTQLDFVTTQLDGIRQVPLRLGALGGVALVWASLGVFGAVTSAVNAAWGVEQQRGFWKHRLVSFLMLVAAGGAIVVGLLVVSLVEVAQASWFGVLLSRLPWLDGLRALAFRYAASLLLIGGVGLVYYFVPNAKVRFRDVWVGAIMTGVLWTVAFQGFSWFIERSTQMVLIHGSVATVIGFLLWVYMSSVVLMYGVEFTAAHARLRRHRREAGQP